MVCCSDLVASTLLHLCFHVLLFGRQLEVLGMLLPLHLHLLRIRQHTSAYVSARQHTHQYVCMYVSIRKHTSAFNLRSLACSGVAPPPLRRCVCVCVCMCLCSGTSSAEASAALAEEQVCSGYTSSAGEAAEVCSRYTCPSSAASACPSSYSCMGPQATNAEGLKLLICMRP